MSCHCDVEESLEHLFFDSPSAATQWFAIGITWNDEAQINHRIMLVKNTFPFPFFIEVFMVAAWCIWNERNAVIFNGKVPSVPSWKNSFRQEILQHLYRIKPNLHDAIRSWLNNL